MLQLYNTLTRQKQEFKPLKDKTARFYTCGPTVYDYAHIGNLRTYLFQDILKRVLLYNGFEACQIMNLTDVDDKTIKASDGTFSSLKTLTDKFTIAFKKDIKKLNILPPSVYAPATKYIREMVKMVEILLKKGIAYKKDGSIYFAIKKFPAYGHLSGLDLKGLKAGARVAMDNYDKKNPADFALWKAWTPADGKIFWQTALGKGRPGWHLECSAIAAKELGQPFDIHAGAVDLIFPHHENEIAQAESATGKKFVNFWIHGEHLLVSGQKMAKSLKNFYTLRDIEAKDYNPLAFRYLILTAHYRSKLNFTWESLQAAQNALDNLYELARDWEKPKIGGAEFEKNFLEAINNDLDLPRALAIVWEMINSSLPSSAKAQSLLKFDRILGLDIKKYLGKKIRVLPAVKNLLEKRAKARKEKNWVESDRLRQEIKKLGFAVEDTDKGQKIRKI